MTRLIATLIFVLVMPLLSAAKTSVVASSTDLAYVAKQIGGEQVSVTSIASAKGDLHFIEVRPSYMMKLKRADVALKIGLELDKWMDQLIDGSRNSDLLVVDCSKYIEPLEVPTFKPDARHGDLHQYGNPHYWTGPQNLPAIADAVTEGLSTADPAHADQFAQRREEFLAGVESGLEKLRASVEQLAGAKVVFYHNSWPYLCEYTGMQAADFIEPYPGVPPTPSHIQELVHLIKQRDIKVIGVEPYFDRRVPERLAAETGARVVTVYPSIGARDKNESYIDWFSGNITALAEALR